MTASSAKGLIGPSVLHTAMSDPNKHVSNLCTLVKYFMNNTETGRTFSVTERGHSALVCVSEKLG
jgi:hypothetical protein